MPRGLKQRVTGNTTLASAIYTMRREVGLSLSKVAKASGLSVAYLSSIELGQNGATADACHRIALAVGGNEMLLLWLAMRFRCQELLSVLEQAGFRVDLKRVRP